MKYLTSNTHGFEIHNAKEKAQYHIDNMIYEHKQKINSGENIESCCYWIMETANDCNVTYDIKTYILL
jgi:hypothetical protein